MIHIGISLGRWPHEIPMQTPPHRIELASLMGIVLYYDVYQIHLVLAMISGRSNSSPENLPYHPDIDNHWYHNALMVMELCRLAMYDYGIPDVRCSQGARSMQLMWHTGRFLHDLIHISH